MYYGNILEKPMVTSPCPHPNVHTPACSACTSPCIGRIGPEPWIILDRGANELIETKRDGGMGAVNQQNWGHDIG
jgi:hypothetical protein